MLERVKYKARAIGDHAGMDRELNSEVSFHIEMEARKYIAQGMSPDDARALALRNFGPMEKHREETRDARGVTWFEELLADMRYGVRTLLKNPGFAAMAIITLGMGIGSNTAIFSVIDGVLLKPLPYANGDRLLLVQHTATQPNFGVSIKELYDYRKQLDTFEGLVEFHQMNFDLLRRGEPDRVATGVVSPNFFSVLGIRPVLGRTFIETDDDEGADAVLVLTHAYWQTRFGGDPSIIGQVFEMNNRPHTVVGVLPAVPQYPNEVDIYMPTSACPFRAAAEKRIETNRRAFGLRVFGLLKEGRTREAADTEVATVAQRWTQDYPQDYRAGLGFQAHTANVLEQLTSGARETLLILLGTTGLILLIACANVANLTLARMLRRDRELAMRTALGAGRWRLVRQLLTESTILALAGGVVGLAFAGSTVGMLTTFVGRFTSRTGEVAIDPGVLVFTLGVSVVTGLLFGTFPALATRIDLMSALRSGGKGTSDAGGRRRTQSALIVAQVAVSVVLLISAGLLLHSFYRLQSVNPGFNSDRVMSAEVFGNFTKYPDAPSLRRLYVSVLERLENTTGVVSAAVTNAVPLAGLQPQQTRFQIQGRTYATPEDRPTADVRVASTRYFDTLNIPVKRGRLFTELDHENAAPVALINESMIRQFEGREPIGMEISFDNGQNWATVVGVVGRRQGFRPRQGRRRPDLPADAAGRRARRTRARPDDGRSDDGDHDHPQRRARHRSGSADRERAHARRDPRHLTGDAEAHGDAPHRLRRARAPRHPDRHHRRHRAVGVAAHAGVRPAHGARRHAAEGARNGDRPGPDAGRHRSGDWCRGGRGSRPRAAELPVSDDGDRPAHLRGRRPRVRRRRHPGLPGPRLARDDGGPDERAARRVEHVARVSFQLPVASSKRTDLRIPAGCPF